MKDTQKDLNLFYLLQKVWQKKLFIFIGTATVMMSSVFYVLAVDSIYEVSSKIKPAEQNSEITIYDNMQSLSRFSLTGSKQSDISDEITGTLLSNNFFLLIYSKFKDDTSIFGNELIEIDAEKINDKQKEEKKRYVAFKILSDVISFVYDKNDNIVVQVRLKDKYRAYNLNLDILSMLKTYIKNKNIRILNEDIISYKELIKKNDNLLVDEELNKILSKKIKKSITLSSNVFSLEDAPMIPYKRYWPKRSMIVGVTTLLGFILSVISALIYEKFHPIAKK